MSARRWIFSAVAVASLVAVGHLVTSSSPKLAKSAPGLNVSPGNILAGASPILVQPNAGSTSLSIDVTGAVIGKTASSNIGMRIAPLIGSETAYVGEWVGAAALAPSSGNYTWAYSGSSGLSFMASTGGVSFSGPVSATTLATTGTLAVGGAVGGNGAAPFRWSGQTSPNTVACGTGGTQTISAAQSIIPFFLVTTGTLSSNCIVDFGTNAVTGYFTVDLSGVGALGAFTLGFKNGTTTKTISSTQLTNLIATGASGAVIATYGTNNITIID